MNSAVTTPESANSDAKFFVRNFFDVVMGGNDDDRNERGGPGGCQSEEECEEYCSEQENRKECEQFRDEELPEGFEDKRSLTGEVVKEN